MKEHKFLRTLTRQEISFELYKIGGKFMDCNKEIKLEVNVAVKYLIEKMLKEGVINYETYEKIVKTQEGRQSA